MGRRLLDWLEQPRRDRGLYFADDADGWGFHAFEDLAAIVAGAAEELVEAGLPCDGVACLVLPSGPAFVTSFFGTLLAGGTPCPILPLRPFEDSAGYTTHLAENIRAAAPAVVVTEPDLVPLVRAAVEVAALSSPPAVIASSGRAAPVGRGRARPAEAALLQFTSGSSGRPRGVRVSAASLEANIDMIRGWTAPGEGDGIATWLPPYHDMGLIGCLLTPIVLGQNIWVMRPDQFIRHPLRWLGCFGDGRAALTAAPTFGFALAARRVAPTALAGMDFSDWRVAIVGAERIDPAVLDAFARLLEPHGFSRRAFRPAYGLAEATLAVTGLRVGRAPRVVRLDWSELRFGAPVRVLGAAALDESALGDGDGWLMGCGEPLPGVAVTVHDGGGRPVSEGHLGEIVVRGPTVAAPHARDEPAAGTRFDPDGLKTGDAGFLLDGELFVVGRMSDSVKVRARRAYVEELEAKLGTIRGVGPGRCVVLPGLGPTESVIVLVESKPGDWVRPALHMLRRELGDDVAVQIRGGRPGIIRRTSSGKPRRRVMWQALVRGELEGKVIVEEATSR